MDFSIKACGWSKSEANGFLTDKSDVIVLGVFEAQTLTGAARDMDVSTKGLISHVAKVSDMSGRVGTTLLVPKVTGIGASRVLLVGLGKQDAFNQKAYGEAVRAAWRVILGSKIAQATFTLAQLPILERSGDWAMPAAILALRELTYKFTQMKSKPDNAARAQEDRLQHRLHQRESRQGRREAGRRDRQRHGPHARSRQSAAEHLHADLPRPDRQEARPEADRSTQHGLVPVGREGFGRAAAVHRHALSGRGRRRQGEGQERAHRAGRQGHHVR